MAAVPPAPAPAPAPPPSLAEVQERWNALARAALSDGALELGTLLAGSRPVAIDVHRVVIIADRALSAGSLGALKRYLPLVGLGGHEPEVRVSAPAQPTARPSTYGEARSHPLVAALIKRFDAEEVACDPMTRAQWQARLDAAP